MITKQYAIFNHLLENANSIYFTLSAKTLHLIYADANFNTIFGITEALEDVLSNVHYKTFHSRLELELSHISKQENNCSHTTRFEFNISFKNLEARDVWYKFIVCLAEETIHCIAENITEYVTLEDEYEDFKDQNQILLDLSEEIMFEYDIETGSIMFTGKAVFVFNFDNYIANFAEEVVRRELVYPEDYPIFERLLKNMNNHIEQHEEFRIRDKNDDMNWCRVCYRIFQRQDGKVLAVGKFTNIATERTLMLKAETDAMTGLLNKGSTEYKISEALAETLNSVQQHFLIILDIDNFKGINDTYGHLQGDIIIKNVAEQIKKNFRNSDILGRIGGDEFIIFLKNCSSTERVNSLATNLLTGINSISFAPDSHKPVAVSIGIACAPDCGCDFTTLYKCADKALYKSKQAGKNRFSFYNPSF